MPVGPGKYDDYCTRIREELDAETVMVVVIGGKRGEGFSCQTYAPVKLVELLRLVAQQIEDGVAEQDLHESQKH